MLKLHRCLPTTSLNWLAAVSLAMACQQEADAKPKVEPPKVEASTPQASADPSEPNSAQDEQAPGKAKTGESARAAKPPKTEKPSQPKHPTATADPPAGSTRSLVVEQAAFRIWLEAPSATVKAGDTAKLQAVLEAKEPYHCNAEYPHKFKFNPAPPTLTYPEKVAKGMRVTEKRGVLNVPVEGKSPGAAEVSGNLMFSVCTDERCLVEKQPLKLALQVE